METYKIELTEYEIELFKKFREYQDDIQILEENNFFKFKNGSMIIHKNSEGKIMKIENNFIAYKKA
ncbi:MAG: hypothetical protein XE08_0223 [Parcubacteria bacterium 32_520]|nr:MAG: hypothetical protein XE08_0223 [Parcubacteria bacterium 32_520]